MNESDACHKPPPNLINTSAPTGSLKHYNDRQASCHLPTCARCIHPGFAPRLFPGTSDNDAHRDAAQGQWVALYLCLLCDYSFQTTTCIFRRWHGNHRAGAIIHKVIAARYMLSHARVQRVGKESHITCGCSTIVLQVDYRRQYPLAATRRNELSLSLEVSAICGGIFNQRLPLCSAFLTLALALSDSS